MTIEEWLAQAPIEDIDKRISEAQQALGFWSDMLATLNAVKRIAGMPKIVEQPTPPEKPKPKCFGHFDKWDPEQDRCRACVFLQRCEQKCADSLQPSTSQGD